MRPIALAILLLLGAPGAQAQDLAQARARIDARDYAGAAGLLEARLATNPQDAEAMFLLARSYAWNGEPRRALPLYATLLAVEPGNADYRLGHGQALLWSGDAVAAVRELERAHQIAPDYPELAIALAQARAAAVSSHPQLARRSLGVTVRHEQLDRGLADWTSVRLDAAIRAPERIGFHGALASERRFGLHDLGVEAGAIIPLGGGWSMQPEVGMTSDADFLPRTFGDVRLLGAFPGGWLGHVGTRHSAYRDADVRRLYAGLERYAGAWRLGYTLAMTSLEGRSSAGHDLRAARTYGEHSEIAVHLASGREAALFGQDVLLSRVRAVSMSGRHALGHWSLLWNIGRTRQGELYTREGLSLGVERRF